MAKKGIKVHVLNVGQGMGNFVEVYGKGLDQAPTNTFIYDLGSEKGKRKYGPFAVKFIINSLKKMDKPKIDLITFSHGDKDHWNLFEIFIKDCEKEIPRLEYGDVCYGGNKGQYTFGSKGYNILKALHDKKAAIRGPFPDSGTSFLNKVGGVWPYMADYYGFRARLLLANIDEGIILDPSKTTTSSDFTNKNSVSAVMVCEYANNRFIFTGDATGLTVDKINQLIESKNLQDQVSSTFMMVVPHHGSAVTLALGKDPYAAAKKFAAFCDANSITASADFRAGFNHPNHDVLTIFCNRKVVKPLSLEIGQKGYTPPKNEDKYPNHLYTAYEGNGWKSFDTLENIYTTQYTTSQPVLVWSFIVAEDGSRSILRLPDIPLNSDNNSEVLKIMSKKRACGSDITDASPQKKVAYISDFIFPRKYAGLNNMGVDSPACRQSNTSAPQIQYAKWLKGAFRSGGS